LVELTTDVSASPYWSADMGPTPRSERRWGARDMAVLWVSMAACITTYQLASSLIEQGMDWAQALSTILLANVLVLVPMVLNAHAGTKYGIPFPVYCRAPYGILGANVPALLRALVACGWFGIQAWIGGWALYKGWLVFAPGLDALAPIPGVGVNAAQFGCFLLFWLVNLAVVWNGIESIRLLLNIKAPLLVGLGLAFLAWAYGAADGFGPMLSQPSAFDVGQPKEGEFWSFFFPALTANVGYWATLALNIPDFSRYARSQRDQALGQALGLPATMALFAFIGVAVTSATTVVFGKPEWDPIVVLSRFESPAIKVIAMAALAIATLATNIAANVVSPANDFAHLWPSRISFRVGGLITGVIGILMQPWKLIADPSGYIFTWLIAYSALLGAVGGVLIGDYYLIRRTKLDLAGLYQKDGPYWYRGGFNPIALIATLAGALPCLPGFLATVAPESLGKGIGPWWTDLYHYAWFVSFTVALSVHVALMRLTTKEA
jgi:NCS1 family nucleobase:cation symporter-1